MFSLIISIIAIALVASLALAAIWYGTDAYKNNMVDARAAKIINESEQIEGAILAYNVEKGEMPVIGTCTDGKDCKPLKSLVDSGYLSSAPSGNSKEMWSVSNIFSKDGKSVSALVKSVDVNACSRANKIRGFKGVKATEGLTAAPNPNKAGDFLDLIPVCSENLTNTVVCCATAS